MDTPIEWLRQLKDIVEDQALAPRSFFAASFVAILLLASLLQRRVRKRRIFELFPRVGIDPGVFNQRLRASKKDFNHHASKLLDQGVSLFPNTAFVIQTSDVQRLILPPNYLEELRNLPEKWLSHRKSMVQTALGRYTGLDKVLHSTLHRDVVNGQLTSNLPHLIPEMKEELDFALEKFLSSNAGTKNELGEQQADAPPKLSHQVKAWSFVENTVNRCMTRVFFGAEVCRNQALLDTTISYSNDILAVATALNRYPAILHPIVHPFLSSAKAINHDLGVYNRVLSPEIQARRLGTGEKRRDLLQWMVDSGKGKDKETEQMIHTALLLTRAALPTMVTAIVHCLYDLCNMPQHIPALREEITACIGTHNWTFKALNHMRKLDSFMKESQRLNQNSLLSFNRRACRDIHLNDGTTIPSGTIVSVARNSIVHDAAYYTSPGTFDPLRFCDETPLADGNSARSYAKLSSDNLGFGYGREACPGRFYASVQIKMVLAKVLMEFEVRYPRGHEGRPGNVVVDERVDACMEQEVVIERI